MSKKLIWIIISMLIVFVLVSIAARSFCEASPTNAVSSFVEKNIPKPNNVDINELRRAWVLVFSKFCATTSNRPF
ncbi:MAG: hypothetical protein WCJ12_05305 [Burkholderiaceae bacterium]